ncbi:MAG: hypothetical protein ACM3SW_19655 [Actinomycetota bacterium]
MEPKHTDNTINLNAILSIAASLAMLLAATIALSIYGYMDHTQTEVSLEVGGHDSLCIHQQCWDLPGRWGQR